MGLDVKNMQVYIRRVLQFFVVSSCTFTKKNPVVSGVLLFFFLLYMFLPSVFTFLIYSLPILIFIVVVFRLIFRIHQQNLRNAKGERRNNFGISSQKPTFVEDDIIVENSSIQHSPVIRRNVREKDKQVYVQEGEEEKDMVFSTISNDDLVDKAALVEENPKEIREVKVDSVNDRAENLFDVSQQSRPERGDGSKGMSNKFNGGRGELEAESLEDMEDEDEEEAQEDGNKAVEWTEVDQKNLMDLGLSEMERNKRLESLIAKRRARKLLSIQVRRTLMNMGSNDPRGQIASILIPKINHFPPNSSGSAPVSPIPGSAPSVLLPMHNPFDLPYDPEEEKPNLTEDNFEEEIMAPPQKDMMFCRHESFTLGAFFPGPGEFDQSRLENFYCPNFATRQRVAEIPEYSRIRKQLGKEDPSKLIETESSQEGESMMHANRSHDLATQQGQTSEHEFNLVDIHHEEDRSEVDTESNLVGDASGESTSSSSSEFNPPFSAANKDQILKSLSFSIRKNITVDRENNAPRNELSYDGIPSSLEKKSPEERFFCADNGHTRTDSIASDLQVEVSDIGSPTLTVDETISPSDGELPMYDGNKDGDEDVDADVDAEKEITCGSEEMWVASSQLPKVEENESRSREVHEVSQQDVIEVGFSRNNQKSEDPVASGMLPEKVVEQDFIDTNVSSSKIELPVSSQTHLMDFNGKAHDEVQPEDLSTENLASSTLENEQQSTEKSEAHPSHRTNFVVEQDSIDTSVSSSKIELPERSQAHLMDFNGKAPDEVQPPSACSSKELSTKNLASSTLENEQQSTEKSEARPFHYINSVLEQDSIDRSVSSSKIELPERSQAHLMDFNGKAPDEVQPPSACSSKELSTKNLASSTLENEQQSTEQSEARPFHYINSVLEQDSIDASVSSSKVELPESSQAHLMDFNGKAHDEVQPPSACSSEELSTKNLALSTLENEQQSTEKSEAHPSHRINSVVEQDFIDASVSSSKIELPESSQANLMDFNGKAQDEVQPPSACSSEELSTTNLALSTLENAQQSTKKSEAQASHHINSRKPEEQSDSPEKSAREADIIHDMNDQVVFANDDREIMEFIKDTYGEAPILAKQEAAGDLSVRTMNNTKPDEITEGDYGVPESEQSNSAECIEGEFKRHGEQGSNLIGNMNIQDRKGEQEVVDVRHPGDNWNSNDPIASGMKPEIIAEEGPLESSSSLSPTSVTEGKVLISQVSLSDFDHTTQPKVHQLSEDVVENNFLDEPLPDSSNLTVSQDALHLTEGSMTNLSNDKDPEKPQEPSNPPKESTQELNSIYHVKDSEVPTNDDMRNLKIIIDINGESHILTKEANAGVLPKMPEERISKSIDVEYIEDQSRKRGEDQTILESYKPIVKDDNLKTFNDYEGESLKLPECDNIAEPSNSVGNNDILESTQECEQGIADVGISVVSSSTDGHIALVMMTGTVESGISGLNQSFTNEPSPSALLPEVIVEHVPIASSSSSSPKSVLQTKLPIDQAPISSFDQETYMGVQQSETEMEENNLLDGLPSENLTATMSQNALHLTEDSTAHLSSSRCSGNLQEPPNSPGKSTKKDSVNYNINDLANNEMEEKLDSKSVEDDEGRPNLLIKQEAPIDPMESSDVTSIEGPGGGHEQLSNNRDVIGRSKPMDQNENSITTKRIEEFGESMKSKDDGGPSMPTNTKDNLEATEVVEGKSKNSTAYEANAVGPSKPVDQNDDSNILVTSKKKEELSIADLGRSIEEDNIISNKNELVLNVDLRSSVGNSEGESQKLTRSIDFAEQSENTEVGYSSTIENDEGKSKKNLTKAEAMVGSSQPIAENDNLNNTKDTEETRKSTDHENVKDLSKTGQGSDSLVHIENSKGETKDLIKDDV